ncbi:MAG: hypothetical protein D6706_14220 [Chloroflexi bacterium]|nr:MAG: hypothetical protein D6706_14220 [Chloroflexota bacterium]
MHTFTHRHKIFISATIILFLAVILYWPTITLPAIYDTLLHIRITKGLNWLTVWLPTEAFGFYRPLTFVPLLAIHTLFGNYPSWLLHGLNVVQHGLNGFLLVLLCWRLWRRVWPSVLTGLFFVLFPFSYQAVAVYGHNVHPTTTGILLAGLHAYLNALRHSAERRHLWWVITGMLFVLGLLSHESAILFGAFAALVHWHEDGRFPSLRQLFHSWRMPWFYFLVAGGFYAIGYQFLPISRAPQATLTGGGIWVSLLYLLQAATYPLTWFGRFVPPDWDFVVVLGATAVTLLLTILLAYRLPKVRWPLLLGWGWWLLSAPLITLPLPPDYLLHGPRLLYLGSVGIAIAWGIILAPVTPPKPASLTMLWRVLAASLVVTSSWFFVRARLNDYIRLTAPVRTITAVLQEQPPADGVVLVNLPQWLDAFDPTYRVGKTFVAMLGNYLFAEELVAENTTAPHPTQAIVLPDLLANTPYGYAPHHQTPPERLWETTEAKRWHVILTRYTPETPEGVYTGWLERETAVLTPLANFGPLQLLSASAQLCQNAIQLTLDWQSTLTPPPITTSIFVQLFSTDGQLLAQADGPPLSLRPDLLPPTPWQIHDIRQFPPDATAAYILVGVYDFATGERYPATTIDKIELQDNAWRIPITPCSP